MDKLFVNKQVSFLNLFITDCGNSVLHDMSKWHSIRTSYLTFNIRNKLKNVVDILSIPLEHLGAINLDGDIPHNFYSDEDVNTLDHMIAKYRDFNNPIEHAMDMTVELVDAGLEDMT